MPVHAFSIPMGRVLGVLGLLAGCLAGSAGAATPSCRALAAIDDAAWLLADQGMPLQRFAIDKDATSALSLDPQGRRIVYLVAGRLVVAGGDTRWVIAPPGDGPLRKTLREASAVSWLPDGLLRLKQAISPGNARFDFYRLDEVSQTLQPVGRPGYGTTCARSAQTGQMACLHTTDVLLDGKVIYSATGFDLSRPWQTLRAVAGKSRATTSSGQDEPVFQIQVTSLEDGVTLRVTNPLGQWQESRLQGDVMTMTFAGRRYGFRPSHGPAASGKVLIDVFRDEEDEAAGQDPFDRALVWHNDALVFIERHGASRSLVLLQPNPQSPFLPWQARAAALPWSEQVSAMRLVTPESLLLHTSSRFALLRLDDHADQGLVLDVLGELPTTLAVNNHGTATVLDWQCPAAAQ